MEPTTSTTIDASITRAADHPLSLRDKVVLVVGASGGIGRAITAYLSRMGATTVVHYHASEDRARALLADVQGAGGTGSLVRADARDEREVRDMVKHIVREHGRIDGLVNGMGIMTRGLASMMATETFVNTIQTNLVGTFCVMKYVSRQMVAQRKGAIVNVSSAAGVQGLKGQAAYGSSKSAVNGLTVIAAKELAEFGVRVNAIAPGFIETGMLAAPTEFDELYRQRIPLKRFGEPDEVASVTAFLLSNASRYMTGQVLVVDGGLLVST